MKNLNSQSDTKKNLDEEQWMKPWWGDFQRDKSFVGTQRAHHLPYLPTWGRCLLWAWMGAPETLEEWGKCRPGLDVHEGWQGGVGSGRAQVQEKINWPISNPPPRLQPSPLIEFCPESSQAGGAGRQRETVAASGCTAKVECEDTHSRSNTDKGKHSMTLRVRGWLSHKLNQPESSGNPDPALPDSQLSAPHKPPDTGGPLWEEN